MDVIGHISSKDIPHQSSLTGTVSYSGTIVSIDSTSQSPIDGFVIGRSTRIAGGLTYLPGQTVGIETIWNQGRCCII